MIRNGRAFTSSIVMEYALLKTGGRIYRIPKAPFETMAQVCERGNTVIQQTKGVAECDNAKKKEWLHASFIAFYEKQGVKYA